MTCFIPLQYFSRANFLLPSFSGIEEALSFFLKTTNFTTGEGEKLLNVFREELKLEEKEILIFLNEKTTPFIYIYIDIYKEIKLKTNRDFRDIISIVFGIPSNILDAIKKKEGLKTPFLEMLKFCSENDFPVLMEELSSYLLLDEERVRFSVFRSLAEQQEINNSLLLIRIFKTHQIDSNKKNLYSPRAIFVKKMQEIDPSFSPDDSDLLSLKEWSEDYSSDSEYMQLCTHYIGRQSSLSNAVKSIYNNQNQLEYGHFLHQAVLKASSLPFFFQEDPFLMLSFFAYIRHSIALKADHNNKNDFGVPLCVPDNISWMSWTPCRASIGYRKLGEDLLEKHERGAFTDSSYKKLPQYEWRILFGDKIKRAKLDLEIIEEAGVVTYEEAETNKVHYLSLFLFREERVPFIIHTDARKMEEIGSEIIPKLFKEALQHTQREELIPILGKIFWWICILKPWKRGDPAIAEMFIKSIYLKQTGKIMPRWAEGIIPWVSATLEFEPETFALNFHTLFEPEDFKEKKFW